MTAPTCARPTLRPAPWQPGDRDPHAPTGTCTGRCQPGSGCGDCGWDCDMPANPWAALRPITIRTP